MGTKTTVEVSEDADGRVKAVEAASGATGEGDSIAEALTELARKIARIQDDVASLAEAGSVDLPITDPDPSPDGFEFLELGREVKRRFEEEGVTEEDVDEAIERARSR